MLSRHGAIDIAVQEIEERVGQGVMICGSGDTVLISVKA